jgi:glycosyltransferase involved in cell wall biosynthesis
MRILLLAPHPFFQNRGTPLAEKAVLEFLADQGHWIDVLTFHEGDPVDVPNCRIHRIPALPGVRRVRPGFSLKKLFSDVVMLGAALRLMRTTRYDLIHAAEEGVYMAALLKRVFGVPYVYDMDSSLADQLTERYASLQIARRLLKACEGAAVRRSLGVLAVCRALGDLALSHAPGHLVACVEDTTLLAVDDAGPAPLAILPPGGPIVMYVGNLEPYQGVGLLLAGFARAVEEVADLRLAVIGGTPEHIAHYQETARRLGVAGRVHFLGPRPVAQLRGYLQQADVLVSPRLRGYNTPMKLYSYLDSGRPVVATRLPTHTQVVDDEVVRLVDPEPDALAAGIVELIRKPERARELACRAKARVQERHTPAVARAKLAAFYAEIAARLHASTAPA